MLVKLLYLMLFNIENSLTRNVGSLCQVLVSTSMGIINLFYNIKCLKRSIKIGLPDGKMKEVKEFGDIRNLMSFAQKCLICE